MERTTMLNPNMKIIRMVANLARSPIRSLKMMTHGPDNEIGKLESRIKAE